jgi:hypothetical protein
VTCGNALLSSGPNFALQSRMMTPASDPGGSFGVETTAEVQAECGNIIADHRWEAFAESPFGVALILGIVVLLLGAFAGGGSGMWHGTATKSILGGWTIRLWK